MSSIGYPVNYRLAIFVLVASCGNIANARYREINEFWVILAETHEGLCFHNAIGLTLNNYAILSYFVRFWFFV